MFLKTLRSRDRRGTPVEYLALAQSKRVPGKRHPVTETVHNFGKLDKRTYAEIKRLHQSIGRQLARIEAMRRIG